MWDLSMLERGIRHCHTSQAALVVIILSSEEINDVGDNSDNFDYSRKVLDTHASTAVLGQSHHVTNCTDRKAQVQCFDGT